MITAAAKLIPKASQVYCICQGISPAMFGVSDTEAGKRLLRCLGADPEGVRTVVDRIFKGYYKMNGGSPFTPAWSMADPADGEGDVCA